MHANHILSALSPGERHALTSAGREIELHPGEVLCKARAPAEQIVFPRSGLISLVVELDDGGQVETALIGCRGAVGAAAVFDPQPHFTTAVSRMRGRAWAIPRPKVAEVAQRNPRLRQLLFCYQRFLLAQAQQVAACNARHALRARLASWLLRARHTIESDELLVTQEELRLGLGVQRASVSVAASELAAAGAIETRRGRIAIVDVQKLEAHACACHRTLMQQRDILLSMNDGFAAGAGGALATSPAQEQAAPAKALRRPPSDEQGAIS